MKFATYFRACSYATVACGTLTLAITGGIGPLLAALFFLVLLLAWRLEGSRWQLSERAGLIVVLVSLPLFYLDWRYLAIGGGARERIGIGALSHLILYLSAVKLLQVKAERDWVFIYLISFFEVLLAAGLSISPLYLMGLSLYLLCALSTVLAFEIKRSGAKVPNAETRLLVSPDSTLVRRRLKRAAGAPGIARRLPFVAVILLVMIGALALPLFLVMPRFGGNTWANNRAGVAGFTGFSESVNLGAIGQLQQSNQIAFRVRVESARGREFGLRWRGVALDYFTGRGWRQSRLEKNLQRDSGKNLYQFAPIDDPAALTKQTFFLEPIDTPYLFGATRVVAVQGTFSSIIRDSEESLLAPRDSDRQNYTVYSDTREPPAEELRRDDQEYSAEWARYLQTPGRLDPRVRDLAASVVRDSGAVNRYDQARAIEKYLQTQLGYTLDLKVGQGGRDPLPDFLFNIRAGHCEYFATAMVIMLRSQGIAARLVNGFQTGEYNDAADVYTVTQADAHSWVEAYFPRTGVWVTFDPTPAAGHNTYGGGGVQSFLGKYAEALQMLWTQYVVGYDKQEQQSLTGSVQAKVSSLLQSAGSRLTGIGTSLSLWWDSLLGRKVGDDEDSARSAAVFYVVPIVALLALSLWIWRRLRRLRQLKPARTATVEFYERMMCLLTAAGFERPAYQTPLEFAAAMGRPPVLNLTRLYYGVRFGERSLSATEAAQVENWLQELQDEKNIISSEDSDV
jgi:transglutaminase-like putative cysteine protease